MLVMTIVAAVAIAAFFVSSATRKGEDLTRRVVAAERRADSLRTAYRQAKERAGHEQAVSQRLEQRQAAAGQRLTAKLEEVSRVNDSLKALPDSADFQDALQVATSQTDSIATVVTSYVVLVDSMRDQHARERRSMAVALADADSTIAVQLALIASLKADRCRVLGLPCPSRSQAFISGALLVTLAVLR